MSIEQLVAVAPPPLNPVFAGSPDDWPLVEKEIGVGLPADYKKLVNLYGFGYFGGYIAPLNPFLPLSAPLSLYRLQSVIIDTSQSKEYVASNKAEGIQPLPVYPQAGGLLAWGVDDNRGLQCWQTVGNNLSWPLLVLDYDWSEEYLTFSLSATGFLSGWLTGTIGISHYPSHPLRKPLFVPFDATKPFEQQDWYEY